jgi:predicted transcriptional regulator
MKALAIVKDIKSSAIYALKSGVAVKSVKNHLKEHDINVDNLLTRSQLIVHLNKT